MVASLEGSRPLLVEVQALVSTSFYGTPQRVTSGYDTRRLAVLLAVLERRVGLRLGRHDVFVTVTGGLTLDEPGDRPGRGAGGGLVVPQPARCSRGTLAVGEVSLAGELRRVSRLEARAARGGATGVRARRRARGAGRRCGGDRDRGVPLATLRAAFDALLGERVAAVPAERPAGEAARPAAARRPAAPPAEDA